MEDLVMEMDELGPSTSDKDAVCELVNEVQRIRRDNGVGSSEIAEHVAAWTASASPSGDKISTLRGLAQELYQRRPLLYVQGSTSPISAQVVLRSVRKPSVSALAKAPAATASLFKTPTNTTIVIKFHPQFGYADILVDPFFTDAFVQQPATPAYVQLLQQLPRAFVGSAAELKKVVALITSQSILAYASNGVSCPPWRQYDSMLARWLPRSFDDQEVTAAAASWSAVVAAPTRSALEIHTTKAADLSEADSFQRPSSNASNSSSATPARTIYGFDMKLAQPQDAEMEASALLTAPAAHAVGDALGGGPDMPAAVETNSKLSQKLQAAVPDSFQQHHLLGSMKLAAGHPGTNIAAMTAAVHNKLRATGHRTSATSVSQQVHAAGKLSAVAAGPGISVRTDLTGNVYVVKLKA